MITEKIIKTKHSIDPCGFIAGKRKIIWESRIIRCDMCMREGETEWSYIYGRRFPFGWAKVKASKYLPKEFDVCPNHTDKEIERFINTWQRKKKNQKKTRTI